MALGKTDNEISTVLMYLSILAVLAIMHMRMQKELKDAIDFNMTLKAKVEDILQNL